VNFRWDSVQHVSLGNNTEGTRTKLEENDILISITADLGIIGVIPKWNFDAYINQHIALARCDMTQVNARFLAHYLASTLGQKQFEMLNDAGAKAGLNLPTIRRLKVYLPGDDEQKAIKASLDKVDQQVVTIEKDLFKYRSIKSGLMQDLLTGKVRVPLDNEEQKEAVA
jgi:type I restriction enzyme S subunit